MTKPLSTLIALFASLGLLILPTDTSRADEFAGKTVQDHSMAMDLIAARARLAPRQGEKAPDLSLEPMAGGKALPLSTYWKEKPLALFFGSISCDASAEAAGEIRRLHQAYGADFQFLYIYIREAHPANGWEHGKGSRIVDPVTVLERQKAADDMCTAREFPFPVLIDHLTDDAAIAYAAWPARCYLIDTSGIVHYAGHVGPWGFKPTRATEPIEVLRPDLLPFAPKRNEIVSLEEILERFRNSPESADE